MPDFSPQERPDTCAIASNRMVMERMVGRRLSEEEIRHIAASAGWYRSGFGTIRTSLPELFRALGIPAVGRYALGLEDIHRDLERGKAVIVDVDPATWYGSSEPTGDEGHAVIVVDLTRALAGGWEVVVDDPGREDGARLGVPIEVFRLAWDRRENYMVAVDRPDG